MPGSGYATISRKKILEFLKKNSDRTVAVADIDHYLKAQDCEVNITTIYRYLDKLAKDGTVIKYVADPYSTLPAIVYWLMGSLTMADLHSVLLVSIPILLSIAGMIALSKYFDLLSLGDEEAKALGVNVPMVRFAAIILATLASSLSVVMAGMIGWVGLIIPHIIRMAFGPSHRLLIPLSAITGAIFLLLADTISRLALSVEIPIGILTSLIGIPVFIIVLKNARAAWN